MTEAILKIGAMVIYCALLIGSIGYFLFFALSLLAEVSGLSAVVVIIGTLFHLCGILNSLKRM